MAIAIAIEVAYALPQEQVTIALTVPDGTSVGEAIEQSGIRQRFPEIDPARCKVGVFGAPRRMEDAVAAGDRIEIYRELRVDPKEARRLRARKA